MIKTTLCIFDDGDSFPLKSSIDTFLNLNKFTFDNAVVIAFHNGNEEYIRKNYPGWSYNLVNSSTACMQYGYQKMMEVVEKDTTYLITVGSGSVFTISGSFVNQATVKMSFDPNIFGVTLTRNTVLGPTYSPQHGEFVKMNSGEENDKYGWPYMFSRPTIFRFQLLNSVKLPFLNRYFEFHIMDELYAKGKYMTSIDEKTVIFQHAPLFVWSRMVDNLFIIKKTKTSKLINYFAGQGFGFKAVDLIPSDKINVDNVMHRLFKDNDFYYCKEIMAKYLTHLGIISKFKGDYCIVLENDFMPKQGFIENINKLFKEHLDKSMIIFGPKLSGYIFRTNNFNNMMSILDNKGFNAMINSEYVLRLPEEQYLGISFEEPLTIKNFEGWKFYSGLDSCGFDSKHEPELSIEELIEKANKDSSIIAVNTLGYMKHRVSDISKFGSIPNAKSVNDGMYVKDNSRAVENIIAQLTENKNKRLAKSDLTFTITTCKRYDLFRETIDTLLLKCKDANIIDRWVCIDDNSSEEDRTKMKERYPFFDYVFKTPEEKGHAKSLNMLLKTVDTKYVMHFEDDWLCNKMFSIRNFLDHLKDNDVHQMILRKISWQDHDLCDIIDDEDIYEYVFNSNHMVTPQLNKDFCKQSGYEFKHDYSSDIYWWWPGFSLNPSIFDISFLKENIGEFNETAKQELFEYEYSIKCYLKDMKIRYVDMKIDHIGTVSSYSLNDTKRYYDP